MKSSNDTIGNRTHDLPACRKFRPSRWVCCVPSSVEVRISAYTRVFQALLYFLLAVLFGHSCVFLHDLNVFLNVLLRVYAKNKRKLS